jgi:cell division protein FtsB
MAADRAADLTAERDRLAAELADARRELRELRRREAPLRAELSALRRLATAAALTPDALPSSADRDLDTCHRIWAMPAHTDTPGSTR